MSAPIVVIDGQQLRDKGQAARSGQVDRQLGTRTGTIVLLPTT